MYPVSTKHLWQHQTIRGNQANVDDDGIGVYDRDGKPNKLKMYVWYTQSCTNGIFLNLTRIIRKRMGSHDNNSHIKTKI